MPPHHLAVNLNTVNFTASEAVLAAGRGFTASVFRYRSGAAALRITNAVGEIIVLPFHGQQIWDATFHGRRLTMRSMFDEPLATTEYLRNYGAFFLHCGATAMGNPGPGDSHPLHGELPNAAYQSAELIVGEDEDGPYMGLTGTTRHTVAFAHNYEARPTLKLHGGGGRIKLDLAIRNLKNSTMDLMYLAHINFRPVDGSTLIDTVPDELKYIRVRTKLPEFFQPSENHRQLIELLKVDPARHREILPGRVIDPELVIAMDFKAGPDGWAHAMQILRDGTADFVSHRPEELAHGVRWITRTADQDALGLFLPATAEADGFTAEKAKGHILTLPPKGEFHCRMAFGALTPEEARDLHARIKAVVKVQYPP